MNEQLESPMDFELRERVVAAGLTEDGRFEFDGEVCNPNSSTGGIAFFWLWVSDDDCGLVCSDDEIAYSNVREAAYINHAVEVGAPMGVVDAHVSLGDDAGSYVRVRVEMSELIEILESKNEDEGMDDVK